MLLRLSLECTGTAAVHSVCCCSPTPLSPGYNQPQSGVFSSNRTFRFLRYVVWRVVSAVGMYRDVSSICLETGVLVPLTYFSSVFLTGGGAGGGGGEEQWKNAISWQCLSVSWILVFQNFCFHSSPPLDQECQMHLRLGAAGSPA